MFFTGLKYTNIDRIAAGTEGSAFGIVSVGFR